MANHVQVKTRKKMTPEGIEAILTELNRTVFKGVIKWEYHKKEDSSSWGDHVWLISIIGDEYDDRVCWLEGDRHFEMRHGGGRNFIWWIDTIIVHTVAKAYNGMPMDDADGVRVKPYPEKYPTYESYAKMMVFWDNPNSKTEKIIKEYQLQDDMQFVPEVHRFHVPKIKCTPVAFTTFKGADIPTSWSYSYESI